MDFLDDEDYKVQVVTDNSEKRVLLFLDDDGEEEYKSIIIKATNRLKVNGLEERLVFSGIL